MQPINHMRSDDIKSKPFFRALLRPSAMIFGLTIFVAIFAYGRWYFEHEELRRAGALIWEDHFYPPIYAFMFPLAGIALLTNRLVGQFIAALISSMLICYLFILPSAISIANLRAWWLEVSPHHVAYLILAASIFTMASALTLRSGYRLTKNIYASLRR